MNDTMKIRLINAYANLIDVFAKNNYELKGNIMYKYYENICETIAHLSKEIQSIEFNDKIKSVVKTNESNND